MTYSIPSMVRLMVLMAVGSTVLAIAVSRLDPPQPMRRFLRPVADFNINDVYLDDASRKSRWLNAETGALAVVDINSDDVLEAASCSPWVDDSGHRQVVGRWSNRTWQGPDTVCHEFGLTRYSFPDGKMLNQVPTDIVPSSPPCWFPGVQAKVLFVAGDGRLYRFAFESDSPSDPARAGVKPFDAQPEPLTWDCPRPGGGEVFITAITWPEDPRMGGRLVATVQIQEHPVGARTQLSQQQIYWLKLNHAGTRIIDAGPMIKRDVDPIVSNKVDDRSPTVLRLPDGTLGLAYASKAVGGTGWSVRLGTLELDADHRPIPIAWSRTRIIATECLSGPLAFSADGRWLSVLTNEIESPERVGRFATTAAGGSPLPSPK